MTDIYDIKNNLLGLPINIIYSLIYIALFIIVLLLFYKFLKHIANKENNIKNRIKYKDLLVSLRRNYFFSTKDIFYSKLSELVKLFLEDKYSKKFSSMTLEEINNFEIDEKIKIFLKGIYFKEYVKEIEDNDEIRSNLINKVEGLFKT